MSESKGSVPDDLLDVRSAASLVGRHPETVRRWVWSGRLAARRRGNRLLMARADVQAAAGEGSLAIGLAEWADRARSLRGEAGTRGAGDTAADLVLDDRGRRQHADARARR